MVELSDVKNRILEACKRVGRKDIPELVAVSKFQDVESILKIYREGQRVFGENYVQELVEKRLALEAMGVLDAEFHFIGHLQSNKVRVVLPHVRVIHSIDSERLLQKVDVEARNIGKKIGVYFQINIDEESSKGGFSPSVLSDLVDVVSTCACVTPLGLMCIPDPEKNVSEAFLKMKKLSQEWGDRLGYGLSMGMSHDFELAVECNATSLRIGSAIFGERQEKILPS